MNINTPRITRLPLSINSTLIPNSVVKLFEQQPMISKVVLTDSYQYPESDLYATDLDVYIYFNQMRAFLDFIEKSSTE